MFAKPAYIVDQFIAGEIECFAGTSCTSVIARGVLRCPSMFLITGNDTPDASDRAYWLILLTPRRRFRFAARVAVSMDSLLDTINTPPNTKMRKGIF